MATSDTRSGIAVASHEMTNNSNNNKAFNPSKRERKLILEPISYPKVEKEMPAQLTTPMEMEKLT